MCTCAVFSVLKIVTGGSAEQDGRLTVGTRILQVSEGGQAGVMNAHSLPLD